jgi:four helix bundle protein
LTKSFEEFEVYRKGIVLTKQIFLLLNKSSFSKEYGFKDQLKRAVVSITNNIAEGSEYNSNNQFVKYLKIAKGSCGEVRNMLILCAELNFCKKEEVKESYDLSIEISKNLSNFIKYLKNNKNKGESLNS